MTDQKEELRRFALLGVKQRLNEIDEERARLLEMFPELARKPRGPIAKAAEPTVLYEAHDDDDDDDEEEPNGKPNGVRAGSKRSALESRAIALLKSGCTAAEAGEAVGRHKSWVYDVARRAGIKPVAGPRGRHAVAKVEAEEKPPKKNGRTRRVFTAEQMKAPLGQLRDGAYLADVARAFGITSTVLKRWADKHKVRITPMPLDERGVRAMAGKEAQIAAGKHGHKGASARDYRPARTGEERKAAIERIKNGETVGSVARSLGIPKATVYSWSKGRGGMAAAADNEEG